MNEDLGPLFEQLEKRWAQDLEDQIAEHAGVEETLEKLGMKETRSQEDIVLDLLNRQEFVTPMDILQGGGGMRASERIRRLNKRFSQDESGREILNVQKEKGTVYAVYTLKRREKI